jgi:L-Ala-D/L-Glu epimerase
MVHLKLHRTGFTESKRIVHLAEQFGAPCVVGTCGESTISATAAAHVAAGLRNIRLPAEVSYPMLLADEIVTDDTTKVDGPEIALDPSRGGLGVDVDDGKLQQYAEDLELASA